MQVRSLDWEDPMEKEMATHSSILSWRIPWTEEPGWLQSIGRKELDTIEATQHSVVLYRAISGYTLLELYLVQPNTIAPVFYFLLEDIHSFAYNTYTHIYMSVC